MAGIQTRIKERISLAESSAAVREDKIAGITTTLDALPFGTDEDVELDKHKTRKERRQLPETVESKALYRDVLRIAWPSLAELFLTSFVSMADTMMVSGCGTGAVTAVSLTMQPRMLIMTAVMALNTGATATIARARGAHDQTKANSILRQALMIATFISVLGMIFGTTFSRNLITFMSNGGSSAEVVDLGTKYMRIQMITLPVAVWSVCITAALRGTGNSKPCMFYNVIANVVNVIFNWILINGKLGAPAMGVVGASIATAIGQTVATIIAFGCIISGKFYLRLNLKNAFKFDKDVVLNIVKVGAPAMVEQLFMRLGYILFGRTVFSLGEASSDAHNICINIQNLSINIGQGFAVSATSLVGQSLGRKRLDMAEHYGLRCRRISMYCSIVIGILLLLFARGILTTFYRVDEDVLELATKVMIFVAIMQPFQSTQFVVGGILRGAGDTRVQALIVLFTVVIVRLSLVYLTVNVLHLGLFGAWIAVIADQILRALGIYGRYLQGKWKTIKLK